MSGEHAREARLPAGVGHDISTRVARLVFKPERVAEFMCESGTTPPGGGEVLPHPTLGENNAAHGRLKHAASNLPKVVNQEEVPARRQ